MTFDHELNEISRDIRLHAREVAHLNSSGDYSQLYTWAMVDQVACSSRPLRYHHIYGGSGKDLPAEALDDLTAWISSCQEITGQIGSQDV